MIGLQGVMSVMMCILEMQSMSLEVGRVLFITDYSQKVICSVLPCEVGYTK